MTDLFKEENLSANGEEEKTPAHKKKVKFDALKERQKKLKARIKRKKTEEEGDAKKDVEGSSDDSEDEYVRSTNTDQN